MYKETLKTTDQKVTAKLVKCKENPKKEIKKLRKDKYNTINCVLLLLSKRVYFFVKMF